jgi:hypothetical protein
VKPDTTQKLKAIPSVNMCTCFFKLIALNALGLKSFLFRYIYIPLGLNVKIKRDWKTEPIWKEGVAKKKKKKKKQLGVVELGTNQQSNIRRWHCVY